ncbi:hypothetical protein ACGFYM_10870 [Streptomyces sp. NPDC048231]
MAAVPGRRPPIATFAQDKGETVSELNGKFPTTELGAALNAVVGR